MAEKFKILIVEDDSSVADTISENLTERFENVTVEIEPVLGNAIDALDRFIPDAVVLDLIEGSLQSGSMDGNLGWRELWEHRFVPLIVYTASAQETEPPLPTDHPFVVRIRKGRPNSIEEVLTQVEQYIPYIKAVRELKTSISATTHRVLTASAPLLWKSDMPDDARSQMFSRVLKRRIAASTDSASMSSSEKLSHWEQFIYPPLESDLLMGDILREQGSDWQEIDSYRVILTPSCDLVRHDGVPKAEAVLVAKCCDITEVWEKYKIKKPTSSTNKRKASEQLSPLLTDSLPRSGYLLLPDFPTILPHLAVNFRDLELITYNQVADFSNGGADTPLYDRILSVDSPFREAVAWAYMNVACRPGLPDRDIDRWVTSLMDKYEELNTAGD